MEQEQVSSDPPTVDEVELRSHLLIAAREGIFDNLWAYKIDRNQIGIFIFWQLQSKSVQEC